jgi:hypothetical protein
VHAWKRRLLWDGNRLWRTVCLSKLPGLDKKIRVAFDWTSDLFFPKDVVRYITSSTTVAIFVGRAKAKTRPGIETTTNPPRLRLLELLGAVSDLNADELREFADLFER